MGGKDQEVSPTLTGETSLRKIHKRWAKTTWSWRSQHPTAGSGNQSSQLSAQHHWQETDDDDDDDDDETNYLPCFYNITWW